MFTAAISTKYFIKSRYQCVEYARRFIIINYDLTFQDIDLAGHMFKVITHYFDLKNDGAKVPIDRIPNDTETPPKPGDLLIHDRS